MHERDVVAQDCFGWRFLMKAHEASSYGFACHGAHIGGMEQRESVAVTDVVECAFGVFGDDDGEASAGT